MTAALTQLRRAVIEAHRASREEEVGSVAWLEAIARLAVAGTRLDGLPLEVIRDEVDRAAWLASIGRGWRP